MPRSGTVFFLDFIARLFEFEILQPKFTGGFRPLPPEWDPYKFDRTFLELKDKQVIAAHYPLNEEIDRFLDYNDVIGIYLYRDPRDVAVSAALYIKYGLKHHFLHRAFSNMSDSEAIAFMLSGGSIYGELLLDGDTQQDNFIVYEGMQYFTSMANAWLAEPRVIKVRYEEFITQPLSFLELLRDVGILVEEQKLQRTIDQWNFRIASEGRNSGEENKASHYRKGVIADYKNHFGEFHRALAKKFIGKDLIALKYEQSHYW